MVDNATAPCSQVGRPVPFLPPGRRAGGRPDWRWPRRMRGHPVAHMDLCIGPMAKFGIGCGWVLCVTLAIGRGDPLPSRPTRPPRPPRKKNWRPAGQPPRPKKKVGGWSAKKKFGGRSEVDRGPPKKKLASRQSVDRQAAEQAADQVSLWLATHLQIGNWKWTMSKWTRLYCMWVFEIDRVSKGRKAVVRWVWVWS